MEVKEVTTKVSNTPQLRENPAARMLPVIWVIFVIVVALVAYLTFSFGSLANNFLKPFEALTATPTLTPRITSVPTVTLSPTQTLTLTPKPTKVPVACYKLNIREGEFASNKCYLRADYDNLVYYLQRFDSANFDLQTAQGTINITCNCRVQRECDFFKNSCDQAKQQKATAETNLNNYRSTIRSIISRGK